MNELDAWVVAATAELGLAPGDVDSKTVLDVARDVAHQVLRPGAPLTAYLMGVAVGRGTDPADAATRISALAAAWPTRNDAATTHHPETSHNRPVTTGADTGDGRSATETDAAGAASRSVGSVADPPAQ